MRLLPNKKSSVYWISPVSPSHGELCHFTPISRRISKKRKTVKHEQRALQDRLERAEKLLRQAGIAIAPYQPAPIFPAPRNDDGPPSAPAETPSIISNEVHTTMPDETSVGIDRLVDIDGLSYQNREVSNLASPFQNNLLSIENQSVNDLEMRDANRDTMVPLHPSGGSCTTSTQCSNSPPHVIQSGSGRSQTTIAEPCSSSQNRSLSVQDVVSSTNDPSCPHDELHGPGSYLSICSDPAAEWVSKQIGPSGFSNSASTLATEVCRGLKIQAPTHQTRVPEPPLDCARRYAAAYFDQAFESVFDIIDRASFERRLSEHSDIGTLDNDPAWYALRNVVYAYGCRASVFKEAVPETWVDAQNTAWGYFENALSVHTELVYFKSNLSAVQALLAMSLFIEGAGTPQLEYMLISTTVRLAQSKGLHLRPGPTSKMGASEVALRSRMFWAMYFYEKHIAYRAGRPSMIRDNDIDCELPEPVPGQPSAKTDVFYHIIRHAQISSVIVDQLTNAEARRRDMGKTVQTVNEIDARLRSWYQTIPESLQLSPAHLLPASSGIQITHILYLHMAYFGSLAAIHSVFAYPWKTTNSHPGSDVDLIPQINSSMQAVAEASRNIILATKYLTISAAAPAWEVFLYPLVGMINLFVYILKHPTQRSVSSDLGLLQMAAGYFGYMDYATASNKSFPFTKDLVTLAQNVVQRAQGPRTTASTEVPTTSGDAFEAGGTDTLDLTSWDEELAGFTGTDMDPDSWTCFLPSFTQVSSMAMDNFPVESIDFSISH
ncbi:hypothetical protein PV10_05183 [Exophiala mesophila]|uniref:Xylanolytic transcriptional activator regulatory domain-containing protein n=1 Tax=Exophiala mesophila TaxID=212818 RepID=A0A0D1WXC6_EXOME|nr:uncharacterized protein PV10_05183 [Exophiala mesophila]KIV94020.1 hypothetical protein PV10_05183 [Exophiala mesophila]